MWPKLGVFRLPDAAGLPPIGRTGPRGLLLLLHDPLLMLTNNSVTFRLHFQSHRCGSGKETKFISSEHNSTEFGSQLQQNQPETDTQYVNKVRMESIHFPNLEYGAEQ